MEIIIPTVPKGHYEWDDHNVCLEFVSDAAVDVRDRRRKNRNQEIRGPVGQRQIKQEFGATMLFPATASVIGVPSGKGGARTIAPFRGSAKSVVPKEYSPTITLKDVKRVALELLEMFNKDMKSDRSQLSKGRERRKSHISYFRDETEDGDEGGKSYTSYSFGMLVDTPEFDSFLIALLHYFTSFFDQLEQELKPHKTSFLQPSKAELQALADTKKKMEVTRRKLGQSYCILILGLGIEEYHHMGCGKKRVSNTHRDKKMFEDMYLFCTYVVWVTFRRKEFEHVQIEVGNILRSEVFNPALQQKHKASVTAESKQQNAEKIQKEPQRPEIKTPDMKRPGPKPIGQRVQELLAAKLPTVERLTPAQHRRKTGKRPAIRTAVHQRSTALVSLLPLPKEESKYLFQAQKGKFPRKTNGGEDQSESHIPDLVREKMGIIGERTDLFNMATLLPKSMENEEDTDSNDEGTGNEESSPATSERKVSHQGDTLSRVTTAEEK